MISRPFPSKKRPKSPLKPLKTSLHWPAPPILDSRSSCSSSNWTFQDQPVLHKHVQTSFSSGSEPPACSCSRWVILFSDTIINISKYFCMDTPQALQTYFQDQIGLSTLEFNLFFSVFALFFILKPITRDPLENYSLRFAIFMLCVVCAFGQLLFLSGTVAETYPLMLLGRFFFGIGSFWLDLCQDELITEWFFSHELALALGMRFMTCRLGSALANLINSRLIPEECYTSDQKDLSCSLLLPLLIGLILSIFGILSALVMAYVDRNYESEKQEVSESYFYDFSGSNRLSFRNLGQLGAMFWLMVLNAMFVYACYLGFVNNSNDILCSQYGLSPKQAGQAVAVMYFSASVTPVFGVLVDKAGNRFTLMLVFLLLLITPFGVFCLFPEYRPSAVGLILLLMTIGLFFSSYVATMWACIPLLVEKNRKNLAFSIIYATLNVSLIVATFLVAGTVGIDRGRKYRWAFWGMLGFLIGCVGLLARVRFSSQKAVVALNSLRNNQEIRDIISGDPNLGVRLLEMMECYEKQDETPSFMEENEGNEGKNIEKSSFFAAFAEKNKPESV